MRNKIALFGILAFIICSVSVGFVATPVSAEQSWTYPNGGIIEPENVTVIDSGVNLSLIAVPEEIGPTPTGKDKDILIIDDTNKLAFFGWYRATQMPDTGWELLKRTIDWADGGKPPAQTKIVFFTYDGTVTPDYLNRDAAEVYDHLTNVWGYDSTNIEVRFQGEAATLPSSHYNAFDLVIYWNTYGYDSTNIVNSGVPFITVSTMQAGEMGIGTGDTTFHDCRKTFYVVDTTYYPTVTYPLGHLTFESEMWFDTTEAIGNGTALVTLSVIQEAVLIIDDTNKLAFFGWYRATQMPDTGWELLKRTIDWADGGKPPAQTKIVFFTYDGTVTPDYLNRDAAEVYDHLTNVWGYDSTNIEVRFQGEAATLPSSHYNAFDLVIYWNTYGYDSTNIVNSGVPFITVSTMQTNEMGIGTGITTLHDSRRTFYVVDNTYYPTLIYLWGPLSFESEMWFDATEAADNGIVLIKAYEPATFIAHFMTPEGEPYPFDVIISDGTWRKEWKDVTYIETEVPETATYTVIYEQEGRKSITRREFSFSPMETRVFEFYTLPPVIEVRNRPYIIYQEVSANASLTWDYDSANNTLNWALYKEAGKCADAGVAIDNLQEPSNYALRIMAAPGGCHSCCHMCLFLMHWAGSDAAVAEVQLAYEFFPLDPHLGTIRTGYPLYNNAILTYPVTTKLHSIDGIQYYPEYTDPQYAVPAGNYILSIENLPENQLQLDLPLKVRAGKIVRLYNIYSPKIAELDPFTFSIAAEGPVAKSSHSNLIHNEEINTLSVDVSTETEHDWWGYFVLPDTVTVAAVRSRMPGAWHDLDELYDYTINPVDGYKIVVVRISPETEQVMLAYKVVEPDLVITEKWLCWPDNCTIGYNVTNIGDGTAPACHNTALYVDSVAVAHDHVPVDLAPGESYTGCFNGCVWGYTPPSDNITVCADNDETLVELDETNNCLTNIWMCGDVNCDGKVTMSDVRKVFNRYLDPNYPLDSPWAADVNCDGKVTMSDVRKVFNRYLDPGYDLNCCCEGVG